MALIYERGVGSQMELGFLMTSNVGAAMVGCIKSNKTVDFFWSMHF